MELIEAFGLSTIKGLMIFGLILIFLQNTELNILFKILLWFGCFMTYILLETLITYYKEEQRGKK